MYELYISQTISKKFDKLKIKNKKQLDIILNKVDEIVEDPHRYKNLRKPLQFLKRVHIDKHFVLTFSVNENKKTVTLEDFDHHKTIYKQK